MSVLASTIRLLNRIPVSRRSQAVLAEVLSQALASGMGIVEALGVASQTVRGWRLRRLLREAANYVRDGDPLAGSIARARMPLHPDLLAAMEIGEERGRLGAELAAAARRLDPLVEQRVAAAIGRHDSANQFAVSLSRLMAEHPLTVGLVNDAARLMGGRDKRFSRAIGDLAADVEGGCPLADAFARRPDIFDTLFVQCVAHADTRESMRRVLARLGGVPTAAR